MGHPWFLVMSLMLLEALLDLNNRPIARAGKQLNEISYSTSVTRRFFRRTKVLHSVSLHQQRVYYSLS